MATEPVSTLSTAKAIAVPLGKWLIGLWTSSEKKKSAALEVVGAVHSLLRKTRAYSRMLSEGRSDVHTEATIAEEWSAVAGKLRPLKLASLADLCDIKSEYWVDPEGFKSKIFANRDISFETLERLARDTEIQLKFDLKPKKATLPHRSAR